MHPLVKQWCRYHETFQRATLSAEFVTLVGRVLDEPAGLESPESATIVRRVSQHVPYILDTIRQLHESNSDMFDASLCHALDGISSLLASKYLTYNLADRLYVDKLVYEMTKKILGMENQLTLVLLGSLALSLQACKLLDQAIELSTLRVQTSIQLLGPLHHDSRDALHDLAHLLFAEGKDIQYAREVHELCLQRHKAASADDRNMVATMMNLGLILLDCGEPDQARKLLEDARRILIADQDWNLLLDAYGFLALIATDQGDIQEALGFMQDAINIAEEHWGTDSERAVEWQGQYALHAASELLLIDTDTVEKIEKIFENWITKYGSRSTRGMNLSEIRTAQAGFYYECGQNIKAIDAFKEAIQALEDQPAETRKRRAGMFNGLGMAYWDFGLLADAIISYDEALKHADDEATRQAFSLNKAVALRDIGKLDEAEQTFRKCIEESQPSDYASLDYTNLASILQARGRCTEAMQLYERIVNDMSGNPRMEAARLLTLHRQAELYAIMGNHAEAIRMYEDAFEGKVNNIGICRTATLRTGISLQNILLRTGRRDEAEAVATRIRPYLQYS
jgi:tetratricopeptide (TPR) repeat protein